MLRAVAAWHSGQYRSWTVEEIREHADHDTLRIEPSPAPEALTHFYDLEWTVLLTPGLVELLDQTTAGLGGTWPVRAVAAALGHRLERVHANAAQWANGSTITTPSVTALLMATRDARTVERS